MVLTKHDTGLEQLKGCPGRKDNLAVRQALAKGQMRIRSVGRISSGIRRDAEDRTEATTEVGDGHSSKNRAHKINVRSEGPLAYECFRGKEQT